MYDRLAAIKKLKELDDGREIFKKTIDVLEDYKVSYVTKTLRCKLYGLGFVLNRKYIKTISDRKYMFSSYQVEIIDNKLIIGLSQTNKYNSNWLEFELK